MTNIPSFQHILLTQIPIPVQLLTSYKRLGLDETEAMVLLQIHRFLFEQNEFPTPMDIASCLTIGETECSNILRKLIQKDMLEIKQTENDKQQITETYSLEPLWKNLYNLNDHEQNREEGTIFILFEQKEFPTPMDIASCLTIGETECSNILRKLIQKDMLEIKQTENDKQQITETYSLEPLWKNLYNLNDHEQNREEGTIFILFEQ